LASSRRRGSDLASTLLEPLIDMRLGQGALCVRAAGFIALLLMAALIPCLVHADSGGSDDLCPSFGPLVGPVVVPFLLPAGLFHAAPVTAHQAVPVDLPVPPPEA
jgi:hypothetical protein